MQLKDGTLKVWGTMIIKGTATIPAIRISFLEGVLYIEDCQITSLDGLFNPGYSNRIKAISILLDVQNSWMLRRFPNAGW